MGIIRNILLVIILSFSIIGNGQNIMTFQGHDYVDLGLSVCWATCNIGATNPEEYGDYFAWGETFPKSCYNKMTYKYSGDTHCLENFQLIDNSVSAITDYTKYLGKNNKLNPNDSKLDLSDDVAFIQWGNPWRMPSKEEIKELVDSCNWTADKLNGIIGYWAVSKINGNKIFFPLAGYISDENIVDVGKAGKYWASELRLDMCFEAYQIWISHNDKLSQQRNESSVFLSDDGYRENGRSVRAVLDKSKLQN